ncbi:MAG: HNH endonuclease signature motif containing protein [bacterium]
MDKRTYADRAEYIKKAVAKRRKKIKEMAVAELGGECQLCGYHRSAQALEVHHRDPKKKRFGIGEKGYTRSWEQIRNELKSCILICANCHREAHAGITQLPSVTTE